MVEQVFTLLIGNLGLSLDFIKIDIVLEPLGYKNSIDIYSEKLLSGLKKNNGYLNLTDKSSPDEINKYLGLSKKAFKKAVGYLYRKKLIILADDGIRISE